MSFFFQANCQHRAAMGGRSNQFRCGRKRIFTRRNFHRPNLYQCPCPTEVRAAIRENSPYAGRLIQVSAASPQPGHNFFSAVNCRSASGLLTAFGPLQGLPPQRLGLRTQHGRNFMSLINLIVTLVVVGIGLWAINTYVPMDRKIKSILNVVVVIVVVLWLMRGFGLLGDIGSIRVGN